MRSNKELKELALRITIGAVFTDRHIAPNTPPSIWSMIFMPVMFMQNKKDRARLAKAGMVFAEYSDTMPRGINGYPIFTRFSFLTKPETKKVLIYIKEIRAAVDKL